MVDISIFIDLNNIFFFFLNSFNALNVGEIIKKKHADLETRNRKERMYKDTSVQDMKSAEDSNTICQICCDLEKDAAFVHGNSTHFLCCYTCCKTIFEEKGRCPYCNRIIEKNLKYSILN